MKTVRLFLLMIAALLLPGTSLAALENTALEQGTLQSTKKSANDQRGEEIRNETDQVQSGKADQNQKRPARQTRSTARRRSGANSPEAAVRHRVRPDKAAANNFGALTRGTATGLRQRSAKAATAVSGKAANHRSPPVPPPAVSVNGQHFRNSRDPGARMAVSGGPLTSTRSTGAINGTNMRRKP